MYHRFVKVILTICCFFIQCQVHASWLSDLIPPYNRNGSRYGCLSSNYNEPANGAFFQHMCAEPVQNINFFTPQVTVRLQDCNSIWCMGFSETLNGDGQCMVRPGPLILPIVRICARIAVPADKSNNVPQDPGYTPGMSLANGVTPIPANLIPEGAALPSPLQGASDGTNYYGVTLKDPVIIGSDGTPIKTQHPKLCTYYDPWMLELMLPETIPFFDPMDYNPVKQPFQTGSGVSPVAQAIINFVEAGEGALSDSILGGLFGPLAGAAVQTFAASRGGIMNTIVSFVPKVVDFLGQHTFIALLKYFGQFNKVVYESLGCVNLAIGPYPPPYNPQITVPSPSGIVESVCMITNPSSKSPTTDNPCALSVLRNNVIHNTVRVGFHTLLPFCSSLQKNSDGSTPTPSNTNCCTFNFSGSMTASSVHGALTNDMIPNCANTTGGGICVNVPTSITGTQFRVRYGMQYVNVIPNDFYDVSQTNDCSNPREGMCQLVLGIDTGNFVDIPIIFPNAETTYDTTTLTTTKGLVNNDTSSGKTNYVASQDYVNSYVAYYSSDPTLSTAMITDPAGAHRYFYATISRTQDGGQDPGMVCVYEEATPLTINAQFDNIVGCIARAPAPQPSVYNCGYNSVQCFNNAGNDIFSPEFVIALEAGTDSTMGPLSVNSVNLNSGIKDSNQSPAINLAGFDYTAFVTDNENNQMPFSGSHSYGAGSLFGHYLPYTLEGAPVSGNPVPPLVSPPVTGLPEIPTNAIYLRGLEYQNGQYSKGGDYICVSNNTTQMSPCSPETTENCVLTQLLTTEVVQCSQLNSKIQLYEAITPCDTTLPNHCPSGTTASIDSTLPAYCTDFPTAQGCTDTLNFYKCTPTSGGNPSYCYALNSGNPINYDKDSTQLCQITYNPQYRLVPKYNAPTNPQDSYQAAIIPNTGGPGISYYNFGNQQQIAQSQINNIANVANYVEQCSIYLSNVYNTPYSNIQACSTSQLSCPMTEYYTSTNTNTKLNILGCPAQQPTATHTTDYCYTFTVSNGGNADLCQMSKTTTTRYSASGTVLPTTPDIEACSTYLGDIYTPYTNIQACSNTQASCPLVEYYQSALPNNANTQLNILGCPAQQPTASHTTDYCYTYTGGMNSDTSGPLVCMIQQTSTTRFSPTGQKLGPPVSPPPTDNEQIISYDPDTQGVRSKTPVELGLCVSTPPLPTCSAITTASADSGYALWPETTAGQKAQGQCPNGYTPTIPLTRHCILDPNALSNTNAISANAEFEPLDGKVYCEQHYLKLLDQNNTQLVLLSSEQTEAKITSTNGPFSIENPYMCSISNLIISNNNNSDQFRVNLSYPSAGLWYNSITSEIKSVNFAMPTPPTNAPPTLISFGPYPQSGVWNISVPSMNCGPGMVLLDQNSNMMYRFISNEQFTFTTNNNDIIYTLVAAGNSTCSLTSITVNTAGPGSVNIGGYVYNGGSTGGSWSWFDNAWSNGLPVQITLPQNVQVTIQIDGNCN